MRHGVVLTVVLAAGLALAASAAASLNVANDVQRPALRVDARGWAEVSWTAAGVRRHLLIPPTGRLLPGRRLARPDVSRPTTAVAIPFRKVLRRTPDGRFWALQQWRVQPGGAVELRFSRWRGQPTRVAIEAIEPIGGGFRLTGRATFSGRPVPLFSPTPEGKRIRSYAYVDAATATGWRRLGGVATRTDGTFTRFVPATATGPRYRAVLPGPNIGTVWAPDAASPVARPLR